MNQGHGNDENDGNDGNPGSWQEPGVPLAVSGFMIPLIPITPIAVPATVTLPS